MRRFLERMVLVISDLWVRDGRCPLHIMEFLKAHLWTGADILVVGDSADAQAFCTCLVNNRGPFERKPLTTVEGISTLDRTVLAQLSAMRRHTAVFAHVASDVVPIERMAEEDVPFDLVIHVGSLGGGALGVTAVKGLDSDGQWQRLFVWEHGLLETENGRVLRGRFAATGVRPARDPASLASGFGVDDRLFEWRGPWRTIS